MNSTGRGELIPRMLVGISAYRILAVAFFAAITLVTRCSILGDWNHEIDVQFYMLAGRRLLDGAVLYVDVWDRKPPTLYLTYAILTAFPDPFLAVQLAGAVCTVLASYGLYRIAWTYTNPQGSLLAGAAYAVLTMQFGGGTAEVPILFAPLMVAGAWSLVTALPGLSRGDVPPRIFAGIACAGLALSFKQSALLECLAFGIAVIGLAWRGGAEKCYLVKTALLLSFTGALPLLAVAMWYWGTGHFAVLWQSLVLSNTTRLFDTGAGMVARYAILAQLLAPIGLFAVLGVRAMRPLREAPKPYFLALGWLAAASAALLSYPGLYLHYALPLLLPLCLVSAPFFARRDIGLAAFGLLSAATLIHAGAFNFAERARSRAASAQIVEYLRRETPQHRLLVLNSSPWLYREVHSVPPPTALLFPPHLYDGAEAGASGLDTSAELRRVLDWRPEAVVIQVPLPAQPLNQATVAMVDTYVHRCKRLRQFTLHDHNGPQVQAVYTDCAAV